MRTGRLKYVDYRRDLGIMERIIYLFNPPITAFSAISNYKSDLEIDAHALPLAAWDAGVRRLFLIHLSQRPPLTAEHSCKSSALRSAVALETCITSRVVKCVGRQYANASSMLQYIDTLPNECHGPGGLAAPHWNNPWQVLPLTSQVPDLPFVPRARTRTIL